MVSQEQRRRQLAREKFLRQQQRRTAARRKAHVRNAVIASVLGVIVVGSVALYTTGVLKGDDKKDNASAEVTPSASPSASKAPDPCEKAAAGKVEDADLEEGAGDHHRQVREVHDGAARRPAVTSTSRWTRRRPRTR